MFSPYESIESLVFRNQILCCWVREVPTNEKEKEEYLFPRKGYFTAIGSSSVKIIADRHRHIAYHNKHWL